MRKITAESIIKTLLEPTGIIINGDKPWDLQIHNEQFYERVLREEVLGLGESYMEGWWDCQQLDEFFNRIIRAGLENKFKNNKWLLLKFFIAKFLNFQTRTRATEVIKKHYDHMGNHFFEYLLGSQMVYSCGYWKDAKNLEDAQLAKFELICQKLKLYPGLRLLDIGCGWGTFAKYAAEKYGVHVVGITISQEQFDYAVTICRGLPIEIRLQDYRDITDHFNRVVSIGMFEHVGHLNYSTYMNIIHRCLADDGLFLLHTIGSSVPVVKCDIWMDKYIFPNGSVPSISQIAKATEGVLVMEDWHNFGADYDKTLMAWHQNFNAHWDELKSEYNEVFYRMWNYYLLSCAGSFRARDIQLWQVIFSKKGMIGGYESVR